jgi:hypothetical protein
MKLVVATFGLLGVNVDKNPLELNDGELIQAQNASSDPAAGQSSIRKRPGLIAFNTSTTAGTVLGGSDVPLQDQSHVGNVAIYIGRGPTT